MKRTITDAIQATRELFGRSFGYKLKISRL
jgi:hypothetical protein